MKRIVSAMRSFQGHGVAIVILLLFVAAYFAAVVPQKTRYYNDRYLRLLAGASDNLSQAVGNLGSGLTHAAKSGQEVADDESRKKIIQGAVELTPYFSGTVVSFTNAFEAPAHEVRIAFDTNAPSLVLSFTDGVRVWIRTHVSLAQLVEPCIQRGEFDDVLLLRDGGKVIYQLASGSLRLAQLEIPQEGSFATNHMRLGGEDYHVFAQQVSTGTEEVGSLIERKLLRLDPPLRLGLDEEEFGRFIQFNYRPEPDATRRATSPWQTIKGPAMTAMIIATAFLYITQRALWDYTLGLVPVILGGITAFGQIVNLVRPGKEGPKPPEV